MSQSPLPQFAHAPILVLITAMLMMQPLSTDLYLASLPSLASGFQVPVATVQLTLSLFVSSFRAKSLAMSCMFLRMLGHLKASGRSIS